MKLGYDMVDLRPHFWNIDDIEPWYRQNIVLFFNEEDTMLKEAFACKESIVDMVHLEILSYWRNTYWNLLQFSIRQSLDILLKNDVVNKNLLIPYNVDFVKNISATYPTDLQAKLRARLATYYGLLGRDGDAAQFKD